MGSGDNFQTVILDKDTIEFLGCAGLHQIKTKTPELGLWIKKEAHGNAYGLEAINALISWARENLNFEYLKYPVDRRNYESRRLPEKNGGVIGREYKSIGMAGNTLDQVEYNIYK